MNKAVRLLFILALLFAAHPARAQTGPGALTVPGAQTILNGVTTDVTSTVVAVQPYGAVAINVVITGGTVTLTPKARQNSGAAFNSIWGTKDTDGSVITTITASGDYTFPCAGKSDFEIVTSSTSGATTTAKVRLIPSVARVVFPPSSGGASVNGQFNSLGVGTAASGTAGTITATSAISLTAGAGKGINFGTATTEFYGADANTLAYRYSGAPTFVFNSGQFRILRGTAIGFTATDPTGVLPDTYLSSPGAGIFRHGTDDAAAPVAQTIQVQSVVAGTTDTAGAQTTVRGSLGTSAGAPGRIHLQGGALIAATGTVQQAAVDRLIVGASKALSNNSTTTVANVTAASDTTAGVLVNYSVEVNDGASHHQQNETGMVVCNVANANGSLTVGGTNGCTKFGNQQLISASGGTLTVTWTLTAANPALLQINSTSGTITPSMIRVTYSLQNLTQQVVAIQ